MRVHFYHVKDQFTLAFRKNTQPPDQYSAIQVFVDLSQYTMQKRKALLPVTKALRNHSMVYRWEYPAKLTITKDGETSVISSLEEGLALLRKWDILPDHPEDRPASPQNFCPG